MVNISSCICYHAGLREGEVTLFFFLSCPSSASRYPVHPIINIALRAAREASTLLTQAHARPDRVKVFEKGPNDLVTDVDRTVETTVINLLRKSYPDHSFLCEESGLIEGADKDTVWIIDPIDGTRNFVMGIPHFCISMACNKAPW